MHVVAGLPPDIHRDAIARLKARFPERIFIGTPSRRHDGALYSPALVDKLVQEIASFAVRRRATSGERPVSPKSIMLMYVPASDDERLLSALDFTVMPAALHALTAYGDKGKQLRHDPDAANSALER